MTEPREPLAPAAARGDGKSRAPAIAVSLALHMALVAAAFVIRPVLLPVPHAVAVSVVLMPEPVQQARAPTNPVLSAPPIAPTPEPAAPPPGDQPKDGMVTPPAMLSERTLSGPRGRQVRADLATFSVEERMVQLCNIEAMDQIGAWDARFRPERIVAFARANEKVQGNALEAKGAAFRSNHRWYDLQFRCSLTADREHVVAFAFHVGPPVPEHDWERLGLPAVE